MIDKLINKYKKINFIFLDTIDSTNTYCKKIGENRFTKDTVVIADTQSQGKGTKVETGIHLKERDFGFQFS